jgi:hypothetical protein
MIDKDGLITFIEKVARNLFYDGFAFLLGIMLFSNRLEQIILLLFFNDLLFLFLVFLLCVDNLQRTMLSNFFHLFFLLQI